MRALLIGPIHAAIPGLAFALAATVPARGGVSASITPSTAEAKHAFTLAVSGQRSDGCAWDYSHLEARVAKDTLVLSMAESRRPGVLCANAESWPFRVEFSAPALDSGNYRVELRRRNPCQYLPQPCDASDQVQSAGYLQVTDPARLSYAFSPRTARAGQAFALRLDGGFTCADSFESIAIDSSRPALYLRFTVKEDPGVRCAPPAPQLEIAMPGLSAGTWQVFARRDPYCAPGTVCTLHPLAPLLAGALDVTESAASVARPRRSPNPPSPGHGGFRAGWKSGARDAAGRKAPIRKGTQP